MTAQQQQLMTYRFPVVRDGRVIGGLSWSHEDGYIAWDWNGEALGEAGGLTEAVTMVEEAWRLHLAHERRMLLYHQAYRLSWTLCLAEEAALGEVFTALDRELAAVRYRRLRRLSDRSLARQGRRHEQLTKRWPR